MERQFITSAKVASLKWDNQLIGYIHDLEIVQDGEYELLMLENKSAGFYTVLGEIELIPESKINFDKNLKSRKLWKFFQDLQKDTLGDGENFKIGNGLLANGYIGDGDKNDNSLRIHILLKKYAVVRISQDFKVGGKRPLFFVYDSPHTGWLMKIFSWLLFCGIIILIIKSCGN
jgi:hypothetical protein